MRQRILALWREGPFARMAVELIMISIAIFVVTTIVGTRYYLGYITPTECVRALPDLLRAGIFCLVSGSLMIWFCNIAAKL